MTVIILNLWYFTEIPDFVKCYVTGDANKSLISAAVTVLVHRNTGETQADQLVSINYGTECADVPLRNYSLTR